MEHQGGVQVRKPEKHTNPKHYYVGGGTQTLDPLAHKRIEGYSLFNKITHLDAVGDKNHGVLDRFLAPFTSHGDNENKSFMDFDKSDESHEEEGGH